MRAASAAGAGHFPRPLAVQHWERRAAHRRLHQRRNKCTTSAVPPLQAAGAGGGAAAAATAAAPLPFFPDRRCVEELELPSLASCTHYINLTNGIEAVPRLQALGLPYRFLRLPSTRCEQQQFEQLVNDLDADLLMRLALGQCCLVHDFGSRNKKRGAPRAVWYGLEFVRYALRRLWFGERTDAYLRGYSVANVFEQHVSSFSNGTKKKLRYYTRFIGPEGLPHIHLYGVYAATQNDGDKDLYAALLRRCEGGAGSSGSSSGGNISSSSSSSSSGGGSGNGSLSPAAAGPAAADEGVRRALDAAAAQLAGVAPEERAALLHGPDTHAAAERLLGMKIFLGGVSHSQYHRWAEATGYLIDGRPASTEL